MKLRFFILVGSLFYIGCTSSPESIQVKTTTVYLVRHAEKAGTDTDEDPPLTPSGKARAQQLIQALKQDTIQALYSTDYIRTKATLVPLAEKYHLPINLYEAHQYQQLANTIQDKHKGETVVVAGHRDNLLPIIKALEAPSPLDSIGPTEYDYIFKITKSGSRKAKSELLTFTQPLQQKDTTMVSP